MPTASAVSRFLASKGHTRAVAKPSRIYGYRPYSKGFEVRQYGNTREAVVEFIGSVNHVECNEGRDALKATLEERYEVQEITYGTLLVADKEDDNA